MTEDISDLKYAVQYRGVAPDVAPLSWKTMAAFDHSEVAERYARLCTNPTWEYRVVPIEAKS